jgi:hypothetical protein
MAERVKYPRSYHLPWSPGATSDDKTLSTCDHFVGREVILTEKRDGENTTLYLDGLHARSIDGRHHPSRDWVKSLQGRIGWQIPERWRVCGENLYARHSVGYDNLSAYFEVFSVWDENNNALSWDEMEMFCEDLGLTAVPVLWRGVWDERRVREMANTIDTSVQEGYVVRVADSFHYDEFGVSLAKWVRANHVQTDTHWMHAEIVPNGLKEAVASKHTSSLSEIALRGLESMTPSELQETLAEIAEDLRNPDPDMLAIDMRVVGGSEGLGLLEMAIAKGGKDEV